MLIMRDHNVEDYTMLRHMDTTDVAQLHEDDHDCLDEVGRYLVSTEAWQRFGVWLLHKHFEPNIGEVFVERCIAQPPQTHTTPIDRAAFSANGLNATALRFASDNSQGVSLIAMEFAGPADFGPVAPINPADEAVLAGLAQRLQALGKTDRFGVRLIRNHLGLSPDQLLSETCDDARRFLHCQAIDRHTERESVETTWEWKPVYTSDGRVVAKECSYVCVRECYKPSENTHVPSGWCSSQVHHPG
jgi:hypothetical protein